MTSPKLPGPIDTLITPGKWDPETYNQFQIQRKLPFDDLLRLIRPCPGARIIDLGCGDGSLTRELHKYVGASETVGVDWSPEMLACTNQIRETGLHFIHEKIENTLRGWETAQPYIPEISGRFDLIFSNAALQWVPDHATIFSSLARGLIPEGQLALQVPANVDHPSHWVADEIASSEPFLGILASQGSRAGRVDWVLTPEEYSRQLFNEGFSNIHVRLQVYGHVLESTSQVTSWVQGSLLSPYRNLFDPTIYEKFVDAYTVRLLEVEGDHRPYYFPFKRILIWATR